MMPLLLVGLAMACSPDDGGGAGVGGTDGGGGDAPVADADGDGISDAAEGAADKVDSDDDGTPDYLDVDSDDDTILDAVEAGDDDLATPPVDSDGDGVMDFRDIDSDDNEILDEVELADDPDGDAIGNYADLDNDGDTIYDATEIGPDATAPLDTDGDGVEDYLDRDADNDTIDDVHELAIDPDTDGVPSYLDDDSDGDCISDALEAGDADLSTPPVDTDGDGNPDFHDRDSDNDGLADTAEDLNCDGVLDPGETASVEADTDGDGVSDLVESAAGTNAQDPTDNPQANGDFVFLVPYQAPPTPTEDDLDFSTDLQKLDIYVLVDQSGSMTAEIVSIKTNIDTVADAVTCAPLGSGVPGSCIPDIWWGAGTVGYAGTGGQPFVNRLDLQADPSAINAAIPTNEPNGCCKEPLLLGTYSTVTGAGNVAAGCSVDNYPDAAACANGGIGFPCFRPDSIPVILLTTDEAPMNHPDPTRGPLLCPAEATVLTAVNAINGKIIGIMGDGAQGPLLSDLNTLASGTGAVDATNNNAPLVVSGGGSGAAAGIENAIKLLAGGLPLDLSADPIDDPSDAVDAVTSFVDRLETLQLGTPECTDMLVDQDTNADTFPDAYVGVPAGTPVCWKLIPKVNNTVPPTPEPQLFQATVEVYGDGITLLDTRDVYFLVPPVIEEIMLPQ